MLYTIYTYAIYDITYARVTEEFPSFTAKAHVRVRDTRFVYGLVGSWFAVRSVHTTGARACEGIHAKAHDADVEAKDSWNDLRRRRARTAVVLTRRRLGLGRRRRSVYFDVEKKKKQ